MLRAQARGVVVAGAKTLTKSNPQPLPFYAPQAEEVAEFEADLGSLTAMGFPRQKAMEALVECSGNVNLAVEFLFANCV